MSLVDTTIDSNNIPRHFLGLRLKESAGGDTRTSSVAAAAAGETPDSFDSQDNKNTIVIKLKKTTQSVLDRVLGSDHQLVLLVVYTGGLPSDEEIARIGTVGVGGHTFGGPSYYQKVRNNRHY
jgi:hypothetical protein